MTVMYSVSPVLLILTSQRIESVIGFAMSDEESKRHTVREVRGARPTSIEWMILAYVIGRSNISFLKVGCTNAEHNLLFII